MDHKKFVSELSQRDKVKLYDELNNVLTKRCFNYKDLLSFDGTCDVECINMVHKITSQVEISFDFIFRPKNYMDDKDYDGTVLKLNITMEMVLLDDKPSAVTTVTTNCLDVVKTVLIGGTWFLRSLDKSLLEPDTASDACALNNSVVDEKPKELNELDYSDDIYLIFMLIRINRCNLRWL